MAVNRVRVGARYTFVPVLMDAIDPNVMGRLTAGETVRVVNLHGCPRANTMGHAHVEALREGVWTFACLVHCNSLRSASTSKRLAERFAFEGR